MYGLDLHVDRKYAELKESVAIDIEILKVENTMPSTTFCIRVSFQGSSKLFLEA